MAPMDLSIISLYLPIYLSIYLSLYVYLSVYVVYMCCFSCSLRLVKGQMTSDPWSLGLLQVLSCFYCPLSPPAGLWGPLVVQRSFEAPLILI